MSYLDQRNRDDPYAPVSTWRVEGLEARIERVEREARERVAQVEGRFNDLSQSWLETYLLHLALIGVMLLIGVAAIHH